MMDVCHECRFFTFPLESVLPVNPRPFSPALFAATGVLLSLQGVPQRFQEDGRVAVTAYPSDPAQTLPVHPVQQAKAEEQRPREKIKTGMQ